MLCVGGIDFRFALNINTVIIDEINDLEQQSESIEERRKSLKKLEQEDLRRE